MNGRIDALRCAFKTDLGRVKLQLYNSSKHPGEQYGRFTFAEDDNLG